MDVEGNFRPRQDWITPSGRRLVGNHEHRVTDRRAAERTRIGREMHDVLAHRLSLVDPDQAQPGQPDSDRAARP